MDRQGDVTRYGHGGTPLRHNQQSGFYAMAQQRVWSQTDSRGLSLFMNFLQADRQISVKDQIAEIGLFWTGPFNARPQDELGVERPVPEALVQFQHLPQPLLPNGVRVAAHETNDLVPYRGAG